eukprot:GAHX01001948.1.p1 GENE.GAHX01001948.1~~GAHX01001948.1.p1  ORF type:complete len:379 (+),score=61.99 GAHX01001948.1:152-1288(+)
MKSIAKLIQTVLIILSIATETVYNTDNETMTFFTFVKLTGHTHTTFLYLRTNIEDPLAVYVQDIKNEDNFDMVIFRVENIETTNNVHSVFSFDESVEMLRILQNWTNGKESTISLSPLITQTHNLTVLIESKGNYQTSQNDEKRDLRKIYAKPNPQITVLLGIEENIINYVNNYENDNKDQLYFGPLQFNIDRHVEKIPDSNEYTNKFTWELDETEFIKNKIKVEQLHLVQTKAYVYSLTKTDKPTNTGIGKLKTFIWDSESYSQSLGKNSSVFSAVKMLSSLFYDQPQTNMANIPDIQSQNEWEVDKLRNKEIEARLVTKKLWDKIKEWMNRNNLDPRNNKFTGKTKDILKNKSVDYAKEVLLRDFELRAVLVKAIK